MASQTQGIPHKIEVLGKREIAPILTYVIEKYGKDFVRMYEKKPESP